MAISPAGTTTVPLRGVKSSSTVAAEGTSTTTSTVKSATTRVMAQVNRRHNVSLLGCGVLRIDLFLFQVRNPKSEFRVLILFSRMVTRKGISKQFVGLSISDGGSKSSRGLPIPSSLPKGKVLSFIKKFSLENGT